MKFILGFFLYMLASMSFAHETVFHELDYSLTSYKANTISVRMYIPNSCYSYPPTVKPRMDGQDIIFEIEYDRWDYAGEECIPLGWRIEKRFSVILDLGKHDVYVYEKGELVYRDTIEVQL